MATSSKIFFYFVLLIALLTSDAAKPMTKEKLEEDRVKRAAHLQHAMDQIKKQLSDHNSGVKNFDERRLRSLKNRLQSYKGQIYDMTRPLSPEEIAEMISGGDEL